MGKYTGWWRSGRDGDEAQMRNSTKEKKGISAVLGLSEVRRSSDESWWPSQERGGVGCDDRHQDGGGVLWRRAP